MNPTTEPNAPRSITGLREIPGCIAKHEPEAVYAWFSTRRLVVTKGKQCIELSADDLRGLMRFVDGPSIEGQL